MEQSWLVSALAPHSPREIVTSPLYGRIAKGVSKLAFNPLWSPTPPEADCPSAHPRWVARAKRSLPVIRGHPQTPGRDKSLAPSGNRPTFFLDGR